MNLHVHVDMLMTFFLVLSRVSGVVMLTPAFSSASVPIRLRAFLALALAILVSPLQQGRLPDGMTSIVELGPLLAGELLMGLMLGLGVRLVFAGIQLTGQIIGHMSGMQLADVFDPSSGTTMPIFSQLLDMVMVAVFFAIGGHRRVVMALLDSFHALPVGGKTLNVGAADDLATLVSASFHLGIQVGAPAIISLLTATLILGFISRTLPQLNVIQIGFNLNSMIVFMVLIVSIGSAAMLFEGRLEWVLDWFADLPFETSR